MEKISQKPSALYQKIKQRVIRDIESGKLKPDDKVPSEIRLAKEFNASRMTANRALKELTEENRIVRIQGVGTFVARPRPEAALLEIRSIAKEIRSWGGVHSARVLVLEESAASPDIARKMSIVAGSRIFHSILLHMDREIPVQYSERFINPVVAPEYLKQDFTRMTPSDYLLQTAPVQEAEHIIEAVRPDRQIREYLDIEPDTPCLCLVRRTWSLDQVATYSRLISPGGRYRLKGRFKR